MFFFDWSCFDFGNLRGDVASDFRVDRFFFEFWKSVCLTNQKPWQIPKPHARKQTDEIIISLARCYKFQERWWTRRISLSDTEMKSKHWIIKKPKLFDICHRQFYFFKYLNDFFLHLSLLIITYCLHDRLLKKLWFKIRYIVSSLDKIYSCSNLQLCFCFSSRITIIYEDWHFVLRFSLLPPHLVIRNVKKGTFSANLTKMILEFRRSSAFLYSYVCKGIHLKT